MTGFGDLHISLRIVTVMVPVALYFLILGLLNSRRHPQLLSGRRDFLLLLVALCPVLILPMAYGTISAWWLLPAVGGLVSGAVLLVPPRSSWVIYNITAGEARRAVARALRDAELPFEPEGGNFRLCHGRVRLSPFPLLRNVSVRVVGSPGADGRRFAAALSETLRSVPAETTPMTMAWLLVATAMLLAPLAMVAPRAGEIVRILTGILQ